MLSGGFDGTVRLWEVETGKELRCWDASSTFDGQKMGVHDVALSADGRLALSASWCDIRVWQVARSRETGRLVGHKFPVNCVALSTDGLRAISGSNDRTVRIWDVRTGRALQRCQAQDSVSGVAFAPDGCTAVSSELDGETPLRAWDIATSKELRCFPSPGMHDLHAGVAVSPDGRRVLAGSWDRTMRLWETATAKELRQFDVGSYVQAVAFSVDGLRVLAAGGHAGMWPGGAAGPRNGGRGYGFVALYDGSSGKEVHRFICESIVLNSPFLPTNVMPCRATTMARYDCGDFRKAVRPDSRTKWV